LNLHSDILIAQSLAGYHTFGVKVQSKYLAIVQDKQQLFAILQSQEYQECLQEGMGWLVLGQGSNVLFKTDFKGFTIINRMPGIRILKETSTQALVEVGAGVIWDELVNWTLANKLGGIENLIRIPGTVGAAPVQNIGAYGMEVKNAIHEVIMTEIPSGNTHVFSNAECAFGYRTSIFKTSLQGKCVITAVRFLLEKNAAPLITYEPVQVELRRKNITHPTIQDTASAIATIRSEKLPDPAVLGNAGSFFKNPIVNETLIKELIRVHPDIKYHSAENGFKIYAGWLLEKAGWRGSKKGAVGCYEKQSLVLVNFGGATGQEIDDFASEIECSIKSRFGITLEREVRCIPFDNKKE